MSKEISEKVTRGLRRMRRLGSSEESADTVSSSPSEEEVVYGTLAEPTNWDPPTSDSKSGSGNANDGYGADDGVGFLNSAGVTLRALTSVAVAAMLAAVLSML